MSAEIKTVTIEESKKRETFSVTVLKIGYIKVTKNTIFYTVTGGIKNRPAYFHTLIGAMEEVVNRLLDEKMSKRDNEGIADIKSLICIVKENN